MTSEREMETLEHGHALDLALLLQAGNLLSASLEPQVVIEQLTQLLAKAAGADMVTLLTFEGELAHRFSVYGQWLKPELLALFPVGETKRWRENETARRLKETAQAVTGLISDLGFPVHINTELHRAGISTYAAFPLINKGQTVGMAFVYTASASSNFDSAAIALLQGLANQAAAALEQARLHQALKEHANTLEQKVAAQTAELSQRNRELLVLNDMLVAANESLDLEEMLVTVTERLCRLLDVEECSLYLAEEGAAPLTLVFSTTGSMPTLLEPEKVIKSGVLWRRLEASDFHVTDLGQVGLSKQEKKRPNDIVFPLRAQGELLGMVVLRGLQPWAWNWEESLWHTLGDQIGLAVQNARLMDQAQQHAAEAQARAQELDAFTYTVSHDLKSPLSNLQGFAEVLSEAYAEVLGEQGRRYLQRISANVQTMAQMIDELLLLSRLDRDERPLEKVDVERVIVGVLLQLYPEIQAQGVTMHVNRDMPTIVGQEIWLEQIFINLIGNAIKFMGDEHPDPRIEVDWEEHDEGILFWVRDNGIGIAAEDQERVFGMFNRLHTVRREGTGLGLAIVRRVIERANGRIWVESEFGKGSRFCFVWPTSN